MLLPVGNIPLKVSYDQAIGILLKDTRIFILLVSFFFFYQNLNSSKTFILPQSLCNIKLVITDMYRCTRNVKTRSERYSNL